LSPHYLHRLFKRATGLTPKQYARGQRDARMRRLLGDADSVTEAIYAAGYGSDSRFYERAGEVLGMGARAYGRGGIDVAVRYCVAECWLGQVLVAATSVGVCAIFLSDQGVDDQGAGLRRDLQQRFPAATLEAADEGSDFTAWVSAVVAFVEAPHGDFPLPLDIAGTAFQQRVWSALREIPCGSTASYKEIAAAIGQPTATRAVAGACAANPLAVAVPCHRVVRGDGKLSGYRWGVARKRALLERERELADPAGSKPRSKN
jgi:AraC family transcriptional regulator of adaptative response/methylated-DNA-[protein]-cysteine methyltransferase